MVATKASTVLKIPATPYSKSSKAASMLFASPSTTKRRNIFRTMYGTANYAVIDEVEKLPYKVADIYRRLTT